MVSKIIPTRHETLQFHNTVESIQLQPKRYMVKRGEARARDKNGMLRPLLYKMFLTKGHWNCSTEVKFTRFHCDTRHKFEAKD